MIRSITYLLCYRMWNDICERSFAETINAEPILTDSNCLNIFPKQHSKLVDDINLPSIIKCNQINWNKETREHERVKSPTSILYQQVVVHTPQSHSHPIYVYNILAGFQQHRESGGNQNTNENYIYG